MSKFTTQLRWIVEQEQGQVPYSDSIRYTDATYKKIGLAEYPIFSEQHRKVLNDKIIDHFYFREIGFETCAQFAWYMRRTMQEIMPFYNEMYEAIELIDDPMTNIAHNWKETWDVDIADTGTVRNNGTTDTDSEMHDRNVFQDTPMSLLSNTGSPSIEDLDYATNVTYDDVNSTSGTRNDSTRTNDLKRDDSGWRKHDETGRTKSQAELMKEYMDWFVNVDVKIIDELETLFMGLW